MFVIFEIIKINEVKLIVDEGNTFIKVAVFEGDNLIEMFLLSQEMVENTIKKLYQTYSIQQGIVASVTGNIWGTLNKITKKSFIDAAQPLSLPFQSLYATPNTWGVDRKILVAQAVFKFPAQNVLIIDAGTCVTYDFVNHQANYVGGAIAPGLTMRFKALNNYTAKLPLITTKPSSIALIGNDTTQSILSGVVNGLLFEIEGMIQAYQKEHFPLKVVLTGGDANYLCKQLKSSIFVDPNFMLEGLNNILTYQSM